MCSIDTYIRLRHVLFLCGPAVVFSVSGLLRQPRCKWGWRDSIFTMRIHTDFPTVFLEVIWRKWIEERNRKQWLIRPMSAYQ